MHALAETRPELDFDTVYSSTFDFAWRLLRRLGVPESSLDDAAQDVFIVVHRRLEEFEGRSSPKTWVAGIAVRVAADHRRSARRRGAPVELSDELADTRPGPLESVSSLEALRLVQTLLSTLDDNQRQVFVLMEMEQLTATEVAGIVDANVNTVYSRLRLARAAFEQALEKHEKRGTP